MVAHVIWDFRSMAMVALVTLLRTVIVKSHTLSDVVVEVLNMCRWSGCNHLVWNLYGIHRVRSVTHLFHTCHVHNNYLQYWLLRVFLKRTAMKCLVDKHITGILCPRLKKSPDFYHRLACTYKGTLCLDSSINSNSIHWVNTWLLSTVRMRVCVYW